MAGFDWTFNSRNQSPCQIAAYLDSACEANPSDAYIAPLDNSSHYVLSQSAANDCFCNTVFYSVISACAVCQGDEYLPWATWNTNCTRSYVDQFPVTIPAGTAIPAWAYMDVPEGLWNATAADAFKAINDTEFTASTASATSSSSLTPSSTSSVTPTQSTTPVTVVAPSSSSKKTNVGAIAGGIIGGLAVVVLAAIAFVLWLRHRRAQRRPPSAAFRATTPLVTTPYMPDTVEKQFLPDTAPSPLSATSAGRLYNPDDPTTFPDTQPVDSVYSQSLRGSAVFFAQNGYQPAGIRYTGVPEL